MTADGDQPPLVTEILSGDSRDLKLLAARGMVPLAPHHLVSLQVALTRFDDPEISEEATTALAELDPRIAASLLAEETDAEVIAYLALHHGHPLVTEAAVRLREVPRALLVELAPRLGVELQEILLLRQDAIIDKPAILDALERNPELSSYARRRIGEYRQHLLPRDRSPKEEEAAIEWQADELSEEAVAAALEEAADAPAEGDLDDTTGLSEAQIRHLPVPVRLRLARGATRGLRSILVRDPNPMVATSVLKFNSISDGEAEQIASSRTVRSEVIEAIGKERAWIRKYTIVLALVRNPRTPLALAIRLVARLSVRDLGSLARDRNIPNAVRSQAGRLYRMKTR